MNGASCTVASQAALLGGLICGWLGSVGCCVAALLTRGDEVGIGAVAVFADVEAFHFLFRRDAEAGVKQ